jgi:hypothetical protein
MNVSLIIFVEFVLFSWFRLSEDTKNGLKLGQKGGSGGQKSTQIDFFDFCQKHIFGPKNLFSGLKKQYLGLKMAF